MPVNTMSLDGDWLLKDFEHERGESERPFDPASNTDNWAITSVPGDIHPTLSKLGRLPEDMFVGTAVEECRWTGEREWWFRRDFNVPRSFVRQKAELVFDGIDLFGTIWLNGKSIGETANSHRGYRFDVTEHLKAGTNTLVVRIGATLKILDAKPWQKYFACFNTPRIFARKAQCQFSWDWAPHLPALGIWKSVRLESFDPGRIMETAVRPRNDGHVTFHLALDERTYRQDLDQSKGKVSSRGQESMVRPGGDFLIEVTGPYNLAGKVKRTALRHRAKVSGHKSFCTVKVPNPALWWPTGSGDQPLYHYKIKLVREGKTHQEVDGRFAFREVRVVEEPIDSERMSFRFEVNGEPVFCKGANWVPPSCFPGTVTPGRYRHLVRLARDAHFNMLRIWGGGIYEADHFYDACDELGVMVWQDLMFACSDYPDDDPGFVDEVVKEFEYQVKRLRNRPCVVYWCGGNEKTGSAGFRVNYGERIFHVIGRGVCADLDPIREYRPASPHSYTDLGNDRTSGDSHGGCYEKAFEAGTLCWREKMRPYASVFNSEFGYHGPARYASMIKFVPENEIWPIGQAMEYHVQDNPYNTIPETFAQVQAKMAQILVGDIHDAESFVRCASTFHGEMLRSEIEFHRRLKWTNGGAMFWMFNDCWPCASWSVVDYYLIPKAAYYAAKRGFSPVHVVMIDEPKSYDVYIVNDTLHPIVGAFEYGQGRVVAGKPVWSRKRQVRLDPNSSTLIASIAKGSLKKEKNTYLFGTLARGRHTLATTRFFHRPWRGVDWPDPKLRWRVGEQKRVTADHPAHGRSQYLTKITFKAVNYARTVHVDGVEGEGVLLSDNFFDLSPGEGKTVEIRSNRKLRTSQIRVRHWLDSWK